jgi:hypothetical protein
MSSLICGSTITGASQNSALYGYATRFTANATINGITEFRVKANGSGNVKIAVYKDNGSGTKYDIGVGGLIVANNTSQGVVNGESVLTVPSLNLVNGTYYWLATICDAAVVDRDTTQGLTWYGGTFTFATFSWVDSTDLGTSGTREQSIGLYGTAGGSIVPQAYYYMN